jgi:hypothetical protein
MQVFDRCWAVSRGLEGDRPDDPLARLDYRLLSFWEGDSSVAINVRTAGISLM